MSSYPRQQHRPPHFSVPRACALLSDRVLGRNSWEPGSVHPPVGYGSWFEHVQEFWEHRMDSNVLFLKYEDMHRDLVAMVEQLARFLGVSCDKAQLEALSEHCHQLVDQCCNAEALPVGRGRVGLWKDIFTVSMNEKFDLVYKQKMGKCDLTFDFYL